MNLQLAYYLILKQINNYLFFFQSLYLVEVNVSRHWSQRKIAFFFFFLILHISQGVQW